MRVSRWVADHLPKWIIYFATIRLIAYATSGRYSDTGVPKLGAIEAVKRWELS